MDVRAMRTKKALANSLQELMLTMNFDKISIEIICKNAGTTRRNFYRHFLDKYDLLCWIYDQDFNFDFNEHPDWTIYDYYPHFCKKLYENRKFYMKAYEIDGQNNLREYCFKWLLPLLHRDAQHFFNAEKEEEILRITSYAVFDSFVIWLKSEPCKLPEDFFTEQFEILDSVSKFLLVLQEKYSKNMNSTK